ncbi:FHA domain-containing protein [Lentzea chajnantorensis]
MTAVEYVPGTWTAVAGERTWLLLSVAPGSDLVRRCWELVRADEPLDEVLAAIVHEGFRAVSGFALVRVTATEQRAVVRGEVQLQAVTGSGAVEEITATGVATWVDRGLDDVALLRVTAGPGGTALPLRGGVVLAGELVVTLSDAAAALPPQPAPPTEAVEHTVVRQEEPVDLPVVRDHVAPPPVPALARTGGVIQSFDWAPRVAAAPPAEPVTHTVLRTNATSPGDTRMLHAGNHRVRARRCPSGHLSSDYAVHCRVCEVLLPDQVAIVLDRPVLGLLRMSTGDTIALDRDVVVGRDPGGDRRHANLVQVGSETDAEISRTHVEVRLEGWDVLVRDLGSTNGTTISRPGCPPEQLAPHIEQFLTPGTRVSLSEQVFFTFEVGG